MNENNQKYLLIVGLIFTIALSRLLPHPWNFTPVTALFIFAGSFAGKKMVNFLIPFSAVLLSDFLVNYFIYKTAGFTFFYPGAWMVYLAYLVIFLFNHTIHTVSYPGIAAKSLISSIIFFLITNFAAWYASPMYAQNFGGLMTSYIAGLPFFGNGILGDLFYSFILVAAYNMLYRSLLQRAEIRSQR